MKFTIEAKPSFQPVTITITLESQKELNAMGALSNSAIIQDAMRLAFECEVLPSYEALRDSGADLRTDKFHEALKEFVEGSL